MEKRKVLTTLEEIKAFSDPYRLQILSTLNQFDRPATVKEISDEMKETRSRVHYHVKKMEKVGILQLVYTKEINGIVAKYYEPTANEYSIKHNEVDEELSKLVLNENQRTITSLYNKSKQTVIKELMKTQSNLNVDADKKDGVKDIFSSNIYLTKEDAKELLRILQEYTDKKTKKNNKDNLHEYHFFATLYSIEDNKKNE